MGNCWWSVLKSRGPLKPPASIDAVDQRLSLPSVLAPPPSSVACHIRGAMVVCVRVRSPVTTFRRQSLSASHLLKSPSPQELHSVALLHTHTHTIATHCSYFWIHGKGYWPKSRGAAELQPTVSAHFFSLIDEGNSSVLFLLPFLALYVKSTD